MIFNFNSNYLNYSSYSNFHSVNKYINSFIEKYDLLFKNCYNFKEQGHILIDLFNKNENEVKTIMNKIKLCKSNGNSIIKKIKENFYLVYFENLNEISLNKNVNNIKYELWNIILRIFSIFNSNFNNQYIYMFKF